jgi:hypothetical protein
MRSRLAASALLVLALLATRTLVAEARLSPQAAQVWAVDRGTTAILIEDHRAPLVEIRLMFPAGTWSSCFARPASRLISIWPRG